MNIIITSEMRTGSRWLHYLLRDLLHMKVSGEIDASKLPCNDLVHTRFRENRIVKFHHATQHDLRNNLTGGFKVIGIVRNPNDRITSWAFHQRFKPPGQGLKEIKIADDSTDAVRVAYWSNEARNDNQRQFVLMEKGKSTRQYTACPKQDYIWTSYHWMKENTFEEIKKICKFLGVNVKDHEIRRECIKHSFKQKSGREPGQEKRYDEWRRKGVEMDHCNFFDGKMTLDSYGIMENYWRLIEDEMD